MSMDKKEKKRETQEIRKRINRTEVNNKRALQYTECTFVVRTGALKGREIQVGVYRQQSGERTRGE